MPAVRRTKQGIETVETPEPTGDGVRVTITSAGICGSDLHMLGWDVDDSGMVVLGHEFAGVLDDGRAVAVQPYVPCGTCPLCRGGLEYLCRTMSAFYGVFSDGGMAEQVMVDPAALVPVPASLDPSAAALVEPLGVVVHGLHLAGDMDGRRVLVIGGGSVGLLAVGAARLAGATVDLVARHAAQIAAGAALGADPTVDADYDVVIDAAGTQSALDQAAALARPAGTVLELGMFWEPVTLPISLLLSEVRFVPSMLYGNHRGRRELDEAAELLAGEPTLTSAVVTHRFPLEQAEQAFAVAGDRVAGAIKVQLVPGLDPH
jgi:threonine dehydrogenase-like Zn-dependent dehydrogenase